MNLVETAHAIRDRYFSFLSWHTTVEFKITKRASAEAFVRTGMQKLVSSYKDGNLKKYIVTIHVTERMAQDQLRMVRQIFHELYHAEQIIKGHLSFDGTTYIFHGQRYPLRFKLNGPYEKNRKFTHYTRSIGGADAPWEDMDNFIDNLANEYHKQLKVG